MTVSVGLVAVVFGCELAGNISVSSLLVNNLDQLSEDQNDILERVKKKVVLMNRTQMKRSLTRFGNVKTKKLFMPLLNQIPIKSTKSICTTT